MKRLLLSAFLLPFLFDPLTSKPGICVRSSVHVFVSGHGSPPYRTREHQGWIVLTTGDTLKGLVNMVSNNLWNTRLSIRKDSFATKTRYKYKDVQYARVFAADTTFLKQSYTEFTKIPSAKRLWRVLVRGRVSLYDHYLCSNEAPGLIGDVIKQEHNRRFETIHIVWTHNTKKRLIQLVNLDYAKEFSSRDFKKSTDILKWVAQQNSVVAADTLKMIQ